jgi:tRNA(fMet)-specific endonuclease VapC
MARRLVDTDVASYVLKGHSLARLYRRHLQGHDLAVSFMSVAELYEWAFRARWGRTRLRKSGAVSTPWWYNPLMKPSEIASSAHLGHVKNGVVVLDTPLQLKEGQAVRVEPVEDEMERQADTDRADRVRGLQQLFAEWTEEDARLSDEEADRLRTALEQNRGLRFQSPPLD